MQLPHLIKIFVINLSTRASRLLDFRHNMDSFGLPFERWVATPGTELRPSSFGQHCLEEKVLVQDFREWSKNEAACGVSHIKLLKYIVNSRIPWAIVVEDDGRLEQKIPLDIECWQVPSDAEIVLLNDRATPGEIVLKARLFSYAEVIGGAGTEGYLISLTGAEKLLQVLYPLKDPIDFQMYAHFDSVRRNDTFPFYWSLPVNDNAVQVTLKAYRVMPSLIAHNNCESSIGNERHPRARFYCKKLLGLLFDNNLPSYYYTKRCSVASPRFKSKQIPGLIGNKVVWKGLDVSHYNPHQQFSGAKDAPPTTLFHVLREKGVDTVRFSVWVNPASKLNINRSLALAKEAFAAGLRIYPVLHYSDWWADPGRQTKPIEWNSFSLNGLIDKVYDYTKSVIAAFCEQGTSPTLVQVGNEITNGMLWASAAEPDYIGGRLHRPIEEGPSLAYDEQWVTFSRLLRSTIRGVRDAAADFNIDTNVAIHIDKGSDPEAAVSWLNKAFQLGVNYDVIGLSFYPVWHEDASVDKLSGKLAKVVDVLPNKRIILAETAFPYRPFNDRGRLHTEAELPFSPEGQSMYLRKALRVIEQFNGGLFWWGATFIDSSIENAADCFRAHALFDDLGIALPALDAFSE